LAQLVVGEGAYVFLRPAESSMQGELVIPLAGDQMLGGGNRVFGTMGRYDMLGTFLMLVLLLAFSMLAHGVLQRRVGKLASYVGLSAILLVLIQSYSRQSFAGLLLGAAVLYWFTRRRVFIAVPALVFTSLVCATLFFSWQGDNLVYKAESSQSATFIQRVVGGLQMLSSANPDTNGRAYAITTVLPRVMESSPIWGMGPGAIGSGAQSATGYLGAYNRLGIDYELLTSAVGDVGWVSLFSQLGALGVALVLTLLVSLFTDARAAYRLSSDLLRKSLFAAFGAYVAAFALMAFFTSPLEVRYPAFYFWFLAGVTAIPRGQPKKNRLRRLAPIACPVEQR
jgi:hypothetical protein